MYLAPDESGMWFAYNQRPIRKIASYSAKSSDKALLVPYDFVMIITGQNFKFGDNIIIQLMNNGRYKIIRGEE